MMDQTESQIEEHEERLRQAMLQSDTDTLEQLLSPDLIFTNHLGYLMTKQDDLAAHRSGMLKISEITLSGKKFQSCGDVAIVSTQAHILGTFNGEMSDDNIRFTRVWCKTPNGHWQVVAGHSSIVM